MYGACVRKVLSVNRDILSRWIFYRNHFDSSALVFVTMKRTQQKVLSGLAVVIFFVLILTKSEAAGFTVNGVDIVSNKTCSSNVSST